MDLIMSGSPAGPPPLGGALQQSQHEPGTIDVQAGVVLHDLMNGAADMLDTVSRMQGMCVDRAAELRYAAVFSRTQDC